MRKIGCLMMSATLGAVACWVDPPDSFVGRPCPCPTELSCVEGACVAAAGAQGGGAAGGGSGEGGTGAGVVCSLLTCGADCVDPSTNPAHCGACDLDCEGGGCSDGICQPVPVAFGNDYVAGVAIGETQVIWSALKCTGVTCPCLPEDRESGSCGVFAQDKADTKDSHPSRVQLSDQQSVRPRVFENRLYAIRDDYGVDAIDLATGAKMDPPYPLQCSADVVVAGAYVFCTTFEGGIFYDNLVAPSLPEADREIRPNTAGNSGFYGLTADENSVYIRNGGGPDVTVDLPIVERITIGSDVIDPVPVWAEPAIDDGDIAYHDGVLYVVRSGALWQVPVDESGASMVDPGVAIVGLSGSPAADDRHLYFSVRHELMRGIDRQSLETFTFDDVQAADVVAIDPKYVFFSDLAAGALYRAVR